MEKVEGGKEERRRGNGRHTCGFIVRRMHQALSGARFCGVRGSAGGGEVGGRHGQGFAGSN